MGISRWIHHLFDASPTDASEDAVALGIEHAVDLVDPKLRLVTGYAGRLQEPVRRLLMHAESFANRIPGPLRVSRRAYAEDPLVHALFGSVEDLPRLFGRSACLQALIGSPAAGPDLYALLGVRRARKSVLGMDLAGGVIRRDVAQVAVYFEDHTLTEAASSELAARQGLARRAFESVALRASDEIKDLREQRAGAEADCRLLRARRLDPRAGQSGGHDPAQQLAQAEERLRGLHAALEWPACLERAARLMAESERWLRLEEATVSLTRLGIEAAAGSDQPADTLRLPELVGRDRRRWVVLLVRYPVAELPLASPPRGDARWLAI